MQVVSTNFTVADYCNQLREKTIITNKEYQRSSKVWPPAARSYLVDTILSDYPIPKFSLYQKTDLKSRKTYKEIVDGQQRSKAILDFFNDELRISGKSLYKGKKLSQLDDGMQRKFIDYSLSLDVFVGASDQDIRQMFRRINSYNVPLNAQEKRHATYQGEMKWFIVGLCEKYDEILKNIGVFNENQLARMSDAVLFSDILMNVQHGIVDQSDTKLEKFYRENDSQFDDSLLLDGKIDMVLRKIVSWPVLHEGALMKNYAFYTLFLALLHAMYTVPTLTPYFDFRGTIDIQEDIVLPNLSLLAASLEDPASFPNLQEFVKSCAEATTRIPQRVERFKWLCRALQPRLLQ